MPAAAGRKGGKLPRKKVNHTRVLTNVNHVPLRCSQRVNIGASTSNVNPCSSQQSTTNCHKFTCVDFYSAKFTCFSITKLQCPILSMFSLLFITTIWHWWNCPHDNVSISTSSAILTGFCSSIKSWRVKFISIT